MSNLSPSIERSIKSEIEKSVCRVHGKHPKISFTSDGFNVSGCCCEKFRAEIISECKTAIGKALEKSLTDQIRKSFGGR